MRIYNLRNMVTGPRPARGTQYNAPCAEDAMFGSKHLRYPSVMHQHQTAQTSAIPCNESKNNKNRMIMKTINFIENEAC